MRALFAILIAAPALLSAPAVGQTKPDPVVDYYVSTGLSISEAQRRVQIPNEAAELESRLSAQEPQRFAGLYIKETPAEIRVIVRLVGDAEGLLARYTTQPYFVAEKAQTPLNAQRNKQRAMVQALEARGIQFFADYDVISNRFKIGSPKSAEARLALTGASVALNDVEIVQVAEVEQLTASVLGGSRLDGIEYCDATVCKTDTATSAFTVTNGTTRGVLTAAHYGECAGYPASCVKNSAATDQTGVSLSYVGQRNSGGEDYEWRTASNTANTFPNAIRYSTTTMSITTVGDATKYAVGTTVCKQGRNTGYTCGPIQSTAASLSYNGATGTYIRVANSAVGNFCDFGDSGGPLFVLNTALGITHAKSTTYPGQCHFMPIQRISSLGLSVRVTQ